MDRGTIPTPPTNERPAFNQPPPPRQVGEEARKAVRSRVSNGFYERYLSGTAILDIGYRGYVADVIPIVPAAIGVELDYPGNDGITLPFPDQSQDAVFASHCLEHIPDFRNAIRDWFRVLRIGGFLVVMVPHQFLYEKKRELPSRYNEDHHRFYTPASLMAEVEASLDPNTYRLRHLADNDAGFDYSLPPDHHSYGCYEIELVVEKITPPAWALAGPPTYQTHQDRGPAPIAPPARDAAASSTPSGALPLRTFDFGNSLPANPRLLVLKLDHLGDFIIGLPSLGRLREAFPRAFIRLVTASWNRVTAEATGLADEVVTYDYFPQNAFGWNGTPVEPMTVFRSAAAGRWDIAIDLRVDADTRNLLAVVDAALRCGVGSAARFPFLDVAMPPEHDNRNQAATLDASHRFIAVDQFESRMPVRTAFFHETNFRAPKLHMIFGPHITLPLGSFVATYALQVTGWNAALHKAVVTLDIARNSEAITHRRLNSRALRSLSSDGVDVPFTNDDPTARYEFRVFVAGRSSRAGLRFAGVRLTHVEAPVVARFRPAALHIGEQLSMLVQLAADRSRTLYHATPPHASPRSRSGPGRRIVVAPLSNSDLRDWPAAHYGALIRRLVAELDCTVALVGAPRQGAQLDGIMRLAGDSARVSNLAGQTAWSDMPAMLHGADLVICNNSGIAHAAAAAGALTLAIYSGSHQPQEWGPRGPRSHAVMAVVPCSPCGYDRLSDCPNEHACMVGLTPDAVFKQACALLQAAVQAPTGTAP